MRTRGMFNVEDRDSHVFCCGEEIFTIPAGKQLLARHSKHNNSVRTSVTCPLCTKLIVLCLVDGASK